MRTRDLRIKKKRNFGAREVLRKRKVKRIWSLRKRMNLANGLERNWAWKLIVKGKGRKRKRNRKNARTLEKALNGKRWRKKMNYRCFLIRTR